MAYFSLSNPGTSCYWAVVKADAPLCAACGTHHTGAPPQGEFLAKDSSGVERRVRISKSGGIPAQEGSVTESTVYGSGWPGRPGYSPVEKSDDSTPAIEQIQKIAKGLVEKDPTLSAAQSVSKAAELHPALVLRDRAERGFGH